MPFSETSLMDDRISFVVKACEPGANLSKLCRRFGISRPTGYLWLQRYREVGSVAALAEHSRRPLHSPSQTPPQLEEMVISLRLGRSWGARKLRVLLARDHGISMSESTINSILRRNGLVADQSGSRPAPQRFQRSEPNHMWQMDFKGEYRLAARGKCYPLTVLDDHSRFCLGINALDGTAAVGVRGSLERIFDRYGMPGQLLMDHGTPWWSNTNARGLTSLSVWLITLGITLIYGSVAHPQTRGKIERFHRTLNEHARYHGLPDDLPGWRRRFDLFRAEYNDERPHEALQMATPATVYRPSERALPSVIRPWEYAPGAIVKRLNSQGSLQYVGQRFFVSEALAGQWVEVEHLEQSILVKFRHQYIRQIELPSRKGQMISG